MLEAFSPLAAASPLFVSAIFQKGAPWGRMKRVELKLWMMGTFFVRQACSSLSPSGNKWKTSDVSSERIIIIHFSLLTLFVHFNDWLGMCVSLLGWKLKLNYCSELLIILILSHCFEPKLYVAKSWNFCDTLRNDTVLSKSAAAVSLKSLHLTQLAQSMKQSWDGEKT